MVGYSYGLYSAVDGSSFKFESGFEISKEVDGYPQPARGYLSYYGLWTNLIAAEDGTFEDSSDLFSDGSLIMKRSYDGTETEMTLTLTNARLMKVETKSMTLSELKGLSLHIQQWGSGKSFVVKFDGVKFVTVGEDSGRCIHREGPNDRPAPIDSDIENPTQDQCQCMDPDGTFIIFSSDLHMKFRLISSRRHYANCRCYEQ